MKADNCSHRNEREPRSENGKTREGEGEATEDFWKPPGCRPAGRPREEGHAPAPPASGPVASPAGDPGPAPWAQRDAATCPRTVTGPGPPGCSAAFSGVAGPKRTEERQPVKPRAPARSVSGSAPGGSAGTRRGHTTLGRRDDGLGRRQNRICTATRTEPLSEAFVLPSPGKADRAPPVALANDLGDHLPVS